MENEVYTIKNAIEKPRHPFVAIFGGFKIDDKIKAIENIMQKADVVIIGGAMAFPFLQAQGIPVGKAKVSNEALAVAQEILAKAEESGKKILLPIDHVVVNADNEIEKPRIAENLDESMVGYDIGPKTISLFRKYILKAKQITWNGPLGKYEDERFQKGTVDIAKAVAKSSGYSIIGGGDTISAISKAGVNKKINHISTGGGVTLKLLEGTPLPALEVIQEKI